jgi:N-acetyl-anhydromuramyl-L-alanine amidase AmpD
LSIYDETYQSPNHGYPKGSKGRNGQKIIGVGVHITGAEWASNKSWIMNPAATASYNAMIKRDGSIVSFVAEENAAYSHGKILKPTWPLLKSGVNPNLYTLSVSRVGSNQNLWDTPQMESTVALILYWAQKYNFEPRWPYVLGHKHIDGVGRWFCPGDPFLNELYKQLEAATAEVKPVYPVYPIPQIQRTIGVEVDGKKSNEVAYLINNATYVRMAFAQDFAPIEVTGHTDHIKIKSGVIK